jgi:polyferredoxin
VKNVKKEEKHISCINLIDTRNMIIKNKNESKKFEKLKFILKMKLVRLKLPIYLIVFIFVIEHNVRCIHKRPRKIKDRTKNNLYLLWV